MILLRYTFSFCVWWVGYSIKCVKCENTTVMITKNHSVGMIVLVPLTILSTYFFRTAEI